MKLFSPCPIIGFFVLCLAGATAGVLRADVIETKDGTRLVGQVTKITDGKVYVDTAFAGVIAVLQTHIVRLATNASLSVRLLDGTRCAGRLSGENETIRVAAATGPISTSLAGIAACWLPGAPEPPDLRPRHHWSYEASIDLTGRSGNHNQLGTAYSLTATLTRLKDSWILSTSYNRQITDGLKSVDQFKAGADYSSNYADKNSWYARDQGGFDHIKDLGFYNLTAVGEGYDFIKQVRQTLTGRVGLAYRYEDYRHSTSQDVKSIGLDLGLNYSLHFRDSLLTVRLAIVPTLENLANVRIAQETDYDIPLAKSVWKLRLGVAHDYDSRPPPGYERLDTTYFGRLVLSWK